MVFGNNLLAGAGGQSTGYEIDQSIRFNDGDSPKLTGSTGQTGDTTQWTISMWVKRGAIDGGNKTIWSAGDGSNKRALSRFVSGGSGQASEDISFSVRTGGSWYELNVNQSFRDPSAWYHFVWVWDSDNGTAADRMRIYVNGERLTSFSNTPSYPASGTATDSWNNSTYAHQIGFENNTRFFDGYLAEMYHIDGQALTPTSFGETNSNTGQWVPKDASSLTFGTRGWYLKGEDSSDLGNDSSGNGNDFTSSGLAAADQMSDTPTNNFAVQNYLTQGVSGLTWSEGNLNILADSSAQWHTIPATIYPQSGKWGYQATIKSSAGFIQIGWMSEGDIEDGSVGAGKNPYSGSNSNTGFLYSTEYTKYVNNVQTNTGGLAGLTTNDVVECLYDIDNGTMSFKKNGSDYASLTGLNTTDNPLTVPMIAIYGGSSYQVELDYGQGGYTPSDSDYKTICTANLDDPTIALPEKYFNTVLYEGNGGGQRVGQFQPITETYTVPNSVIFNDNDSAYLNRTPSSDGNRQTMTFSWWMKRGNLNITDCRIFTARDSNDDQINFRDASDYNRLDVFFDGTSGGRLSTSRAFDDSSMWNHCVVAIDTTQSTAADRVKIYINGVRVTEFDTETQPSLNKNLNGFNNNGAHAIGARAWSGAAGFYDGYLTEIYFIDGQQLDASSFGQLDASTNKWIPKDASGLTFGTNGYYLDMETAPGTGSGAGTDSSGNGNNWSESGFAAADQVTDSPTKNFATLDSRRSIATSTLTDGNLAMSGYAASSSAYGTIGLSKNTGKWFWQMVAQANAMAGISATPNGSQYPGQASDSYAMDLTNGTKYNNGSSSSYGSGEISAGNVIGISYDTSNGALNFYDSDGNDIGVAYYVDYDKTYFPVFRNGNSANISVNFGQTGSFTFTPSGFNQINNDNLPLSNGDLSAFVWIKNRDAADNHMLFDAVRGVTKDMHSNSTAAEVTNANTLTRFLKNGFEVSNDAEVNTSGESYAAWQWLNDSLTTSSNEDGSTTSTVLANTTSGFSIATYTGTGSNATVGHGLGVAPSFVLVKSQNDTHDWYVWTPALATTEFLKLTAAAKGTSSPEVWNSTAPTSSVVSLGTSIGVNRNTYNYVMYCFAEVEGFSKISSFEGNSNADGAFIYTGFKPAFILNKNIDTADQWGIRDAARNPFNVTDKLLNPNAATAETTSSTGYIDILSNGFKARSSDSNINTQTITYMAFAESPFKTATAR